MTEDASAVTTVSVVVPTHDRLPFLRQCLQALEVQRCPRARLEVVVVADGCRDGTEQALASSRYGFALRVLSQPASGAAAARNRGAREASGEVLVFVDDDVVASPGLVAAHVGVHAARGEVVAVGPYLPERPAGGGFFAERLHRFWHDTFAAMAAPDHRPTYTDVLAGNLSMRRETFERVGGFDPAFDSCGVEDYELGVRLLALGVPIVYAADAQALHLDTTDLPRSLRRARQGGYADVLLASLHPAVLPTLRLARPDPGPPWGVFQAPDAGRLVAASAIRLLDVAERLGRRGAWTALYGWLHRYWYWRGVADRVGDAAGLRAWLARTGRAPCGDAGPAIAPARRASATGGGAAR